MDITERKKQYYIDNKERIKEKALKYYYDNKEKRIVYNKGYWDLHKHKYLKQRSEDIIYKTNQRLYYQSYKENKKHIYTKLTKLTDVTAANYKTEHDFIEAFIG